MAPRLPFRLPDFASRPRTRKVLQVVGLTFLFIIVFVFALQATFPYDRVKDKLIEGLSDKYDVTIAKVERGLLPGNVTFKSVTLKSRPTKPGEVASVFFINKLELSAGLMSLLGGTISLDAEATIGPGTLTAEIEVGGFGKGDINAHVVGRRLPGDTLPMASVIGLPMTGKIEFDVSLGLPREKSKGKVAINWQKVRGSFSLACPGGCTFGDGVTKLKPLLKNTRNQVMVGEGIDFGKVTMDSLVAKATIKAGKLTLDKFDTKSKDGELKVDYMMTLEKDFDESVVAGCLRFKGSDDLLKREPKTYAAIQTTGAELRGDGLFHIRLSDRFKDMKRLNQECGPNANSNGNGENFSGKPDRPNLTINNNNDETKPALTPAVPSPTPVPAIADGGIGSAATADGGVPPTGGPAGPPNPANADTPATPTITNDPPGARERAGQQHRIEQPAGSGSAQPPGEGSAAPAMPPAE